ncbi:Phosphoglycerate kinase [Dissulfuribacter thermophilus]|uniref:Phosphoglycerate kinase n=2 Tax=Dissulfuribacter thermophilus TaxID=1156395 RepID=A0A1B9F3P6_9BACT|nr:phosphoglycerate kinase [Dissulfuribacter thermophilus]OCC14559.1 Phosphoglycerate kinase [Dissulfuribacter thermophilus]
MKSIDQLSISGKKVLMRVDLNCPLSKEGDVADDTRILAVLPSINYCIEQGAKLILCSHLGRPKGERRPEFSLGPVAKRLSEILGKEVRLSNDCIGDQVKQDVEALKNGDVLLLENIRFHPGETKNDHTLAKELGELADIFINDAFAVCHRAHASVVGVTEFVKECGMGFLLKKEMDYFHKAIENPVRPLVAIMGGAKVSSKLGAIKNILNKVDKLIIGGAMANTFLKAKGVDVGDSMIEEDLIEEARSILEKASSLGIPLYLPVDAVVSRSMEDAVQIIKPYGEIPTGWKAFDIGPATVTLYREALQDAKTVVWNGPLGAFEEKSFSRGTFAISSTLASLHALTIVGGGDTDRAIHEAGDTSEISYMSTGGGAFLHLLEGKELPGVKALERCGG